MAKRQRPMTKLFRQPGKGKGVHWEGSLIEGAGRVTLESSGLGTFDVTWASRAEDPRAFDDRFLPA